MLFPATVFDLKNIPIWERNSSCRGSEERQILGRDKAREGSLTLTSFGGGLRFAWLFGRLQKSSRHRLNNMKCPFVHIVCTAILGILTLGNFNRGLLLYQIFFAGENSIAFLKCCFTSVRLWRRLNSARRVRSSVLLPRNVCGLESNSTMSNFFKSHTITKISSQDSAFLRLKMQEVTGERRKVLLDARRHVYVHRIFHNASHEHKCRQCSHTYFLRRLLQKDATFRDPGKPHAACGDEAEHMRPCGQFCSRQKIRLDHSIQQGDRRKQRTDKLDWRVHEEYCEKHESGQIQMKDCENYKLGQRAANSSDKHQEKKLHLKYQDQKHKGGVDVRPQGEHRAWLGYLECCSQLQTKPRHCSGNQEGQACRTYQILQEWVGTHQTQCQTTQGTIFCKHVDKGQQTALTSVDGKGQTDLTNVTGQSEIFPKRCEKLEGRMIVTSEQQLNSQINIRITCQPLNGHVSLKLTFPQRNGQINGKLTFHQLKGLIPSYPQLGTRMSLSYMCQTVTEKTPLTFAGQQQSGHDTGGQVDGETYLTLKSRRSKDGNVQNEENMGNAIFTPLRIPLSGNKGRGVLARSATPEDHVGVLGKLYVPTGKGTREYQRTLNASDSWVDDRQLEDATSHSASSLVARRHEEEAGGASIAYPAASCRSESTTSGTCETRRFNSVRGRELRYAYAQRRFYGALTSSTVLVLSLCSLLLYVPLAACRDKTIVLGVFLPKVESPEVIKVYNRTLDVMLSKVSKRLPDFAFETKVTFEECNPWQGMANFIDLYKSTHVNFFIGPACDEVCMAVAPLAHYWQVPFITYGCRSVVHDLESDIDFVSSAVSFQHMCIVIAKVFKEHSWQRAMLVSSLSSETRWIAKMDILQEDLEKISVTVLRWVANMEDSDNDIVQSMRSNALQAYVFILCVIPEEVIALHKILWQHELFKKGLAYFTFDFYNHGWVQGAPEVQIQAMTGLLDITINTFETESDYDAFVKEINTTSRAFSTSCKYKEIGTRVSEFADAILLMGHCLELNDKEMPNAPCNTSILHTKTFPGVAGDVKIDSLGIRAGEITVNNLVEGCYRVAAKATVTSGQDSRNWEISFRKIHPITWPGGSADPPPYTATCGWGIEHCHSLSGTTITLTVTGAVVAALAVLSCACLFFFVCRRLYAERELGSKDWIIPFHKLFPTGTSESKAGKLTGAIANWRRKTSQGTKPAAGRTFSHESLKALAGGRTFTKVTVYNNQLVAIKPINKEVITVTYEVTKEFNQIRRLKHSNINQLIGACVEIGNISLVSLYCQKGSLQDVLLSGSIKLDIVFQLSFLWDIAAGMEYLHESLVGRHGRLKSSNILVDSNWTCKITDIAKPYFREGEIVSPNKNLQSLLWMAPELLHDVALQRRGGTKKGDVYAFGIVMQEIILRSLPYGIGLNDNPREILQRVRKREKPPFRPVVPRSAATVNVLDLMYICWDDIDLFRPPFHVICGIIKHLRSEFGSANLVDQMLHMLSKYADNLEELVEHRNAQLEEEQTKTEELLCRMLPKSVARDLKLGNEVVPESFAAVTIYFSDIVGFTSLAASSTPLQVVNLLNDLYTCFDNVIDKFDVYKVETIGDAYMVVSGLPVRNGDLHASEIATMSLELLNSVVNFRIRHRPEKQLQIRIGIHTGSVVAGVVGLKMPRYCLFGDTVNYASRMESTGIALHIHVSPECKSYLDKLGGFVLKERGPTEMKGKGVITTYFLIGKTVEATEIY